MLLGETVSEFNAPPRHSFCRFRDSVLSGDKAQCVSCLPRIVIDSTVNEKQNLVSVDDDVSL